jgi:hypothetical protein
MCGEMRNAYIMLIGKSKAKRPVGRPACNRKDTNGWKKGVDWIQIVKTRPSGRLLNIFVHKKWEIC